MMVVAVVEKDPQSTQKNTYKADVVMQADRHHDLFFKIRKLHGVFTFSRSLYCRGHQYELYCVYLTFFLKIHMGPYKTRKPSRKRRAENISSKVAQLFK